MSEKWRQEVIRDKMDKRLPAINRGKRWQSGFSWRLLLGLFGYSLLITSPRVWFDWGTLSISRLLERCVGDTLIALTICLFFTHLFTSLVLTRRQHKLWGIGITSLILIFVAYLCFYNDALLSNILPIGILAGMTAFSCGANVGMLAVLTLSLLLGILDLVKPESIITFFVSGCFFAWLAPAQRFRIGIFRLTALSAALAVATGIIWTLGVGDVVYVRHAAVSTNVILLDSNDPLVRCLWSVGGWLLSLIVILSTLRYQYAIFGNTSNIVLQDLQENPLLGKLLTIAPSSFYHCTVTSALAGAAAEAIGANVVLCRIGSLYHDIGKLIKPEYFTENEGGLSRHDALSPYMSNLIIISHVKDGAEVARHCNLPPEILEMIEQHHGTSQVSFFLRQAKEEAKGAPVDEALFRYPGPRPQTPEAAIVMIADSIEAASRSLAGNSAAQIKTLVNKIVLGKLHDHQLDDSHLTFTDLTHIEDAITRILVSMFHSRVSYDQPKKR